MKVRPAKSAFDAFWSVTKVRSVGDFRLSCGSIRETWLEDSTENSEILVQVAGWAKLGYFGKYDVNDNKAIGGVGDK